MINIFFTAARKMRTWHIVAASMLISAILTECIVSAMDILIHGAVTRDFLLTGAVAAIIVSFVVTTILVTALNRVREHEALLQDSEKRYRQIFQQAVDYIIMLELAPGGPPVIADASEAAFEKHGYTREEMIGKPITLLDADATGNQMAEIMRILMERKIAHFEAEHVRKDGQRFTVEVNAKLIDIGGKPVVYTIERDITERKKLEEHKIELLRQTISAMEEAQKADQMKSDAQRLAHLGNWEMDLQKNRLVWSDEIFRIMGFAPGAFEPTFEKFLSIVHPDERNKLVGLLEEIRAKGLSATELEFKIVRPDGEERAILDKLEIIKDGGAAVRITGILQDITWLKRAEEAVRNSALKHRLLFESSRDALMLLAPPSWKFTNANKATLELFGASSVDEFTALGPWNVSPERQPNGRPSSEMAQEMIAAAMRDGSRFFEWEHQRLDGQPFAADVMLTRMEVGNELFLQATVRDISQRKRQENQLVKAKEDAETANRLKSEFVANMSHELNTPLTAIMGYSRLANELDGEIAAKLKIISELIEPLAEAGPAGLKDTLQVANSALDTSYETAKYDAIVLEKGEELFNLLNDLMELSMLEAGRTQLADEAVSTYLLLAFLDRTYGPASKAKGLTLVCNAKDFRPTDTLFQSDRRKLEKVLGHLVQNAIKYSDKGEISVSATVEDGNIVFCVKDQGMGIQSSQKEMLFEAFRQLDGSSTRRQGGLGLGLSLARKLTIAMGGHIGVQSEVGQGAEFTVTLPYRPAS